MVPERARSGGGACAPVSSEEMKRGRWDLLRFIRLAAFAERVLDLFKVRGCQIKTRRDPEYPGCLYLEMKMCLAPCFAGCPKEEYDAEVARLVQFLDTNGDSLRACSRLLAPAAAEEG
jgi:hypothetical protein